MEFQVLGPIRILRDGENVLGPGRIGRTLVAVLLSRADEPVPVDALLEAAWPDHAGSDPTNRLHVVVSRLRGTLGDSDRLVLEHGAYRLRVASGELDSERFESLVDEATDHADDPDRCVELVRKALDLWRGTPYAGLDVPMLADDAQRLVERRLGGLEMLWEAELARGRHAAAVGELTDLSRRHPFRERFHALLMTALYRSGRQTEALEVYQSARATYVEELGLDPGPELRDLEQQILAGEPIALGATTSNAAEAPIPAQLPTQPVGFVGRDHEVAELDRILLDAPDPTPIAVISGTAGVGKTALAIRWAHHARHHFPDGQLYTDLHGYDPDQPIGATAALAGFLRALGVADQTIPTDPNELAAQFRSIVADRRLLVVLDNANTVEQIRPLLPGTASVPVVITSRDQLAGLSIREGAHRIDLDRMSTADAHDLLRALVGGRVDTELDATADLIERCAHLPLALRIAAELARSRPGGALTDLADDLADAQGPLELLDIDGDPHAAVRTVFSWSYDGLPADAARLFRLFGLHPGHDVDPFALSALAGGPARSVRRHVDTLRRAHLVEPTEDHRLRQHDLLRAYAAELAETTDPEPDRDAVMDRLLAYYLATASQAMNLIAPHESYRRPEVEPFDGDAPQPGDYDTALRWLDREYANLLSAAGWAVDHDRYPYPHQLTVTIWRFLASRGHSSDGLWLFARTLEAARRHSDRRAEGDALRLIGLFHYNSGRHDDAARYSEEALVIHRALDDVPAEAAILSNLAGVHYAAGRLQQSIDQLEQSIALYRRLGYEKQLAGPLNNVGQVLIQLGRYDDARERLELAVSLAEREQSREDAALARQNLAHLERVLGHYGPAAEQVRRVFDTASNDGLTTLEGGAWHAQGAIHLALGEWDRAVESYQSALAIAERTGDRLLLVQTRNGLGDVATSGGDPSAALDHHGIALEAARDVRYEQGRAHAGMGEAYAALGDRELATEHWRQAHELYADMGVPEAAEIEAKLGG